MILNEPSLSFHFRLEYTMACVVVDDLFSDTNEDRGNDLRMHYFLFNFESYFTPQICRKSFIQAASLRQHMMRHHDESSQNDARNKNPKASGKTISLIGIVWRK